MKDKQLAGQVMAAWENSQRLIKMGLAQPNASDAPANELSIEANLRSFSDGMSAAGRSEAHVARTKQLIEAICRHNSWTRLSDITGIGIDKYSTHLRQDLGQSARKVGSAITAIRSLCRWAMRQNRLTVDPTVSLSKPSVKKDRRIERRMLLPDEWKWLRKTLASSDVVRNGQDAQERLLMYWLAIETGLRSSELRGLPMKQVVLGAGDPHVLAKASTTKDAKLARQFISDQLAAKLGEHTAHKLPSAPVFGVYSRHVMAKVLRADLLDARNAWLAKDPKRAKSVSSSDFLVGSVSTGEALDFHSLRHTTGAWLVMEGVSLPEVQAIMRHSTITLTIDHYGHLAPDAKSGRRNTLSSLMA